MKYRILFVLQKKTGSDARYLHCRVKWQSSRHVVGVSVGYRIDPSKWSAEAQRCKPNSYHGPGKVPAAEINAEIDRYTQAAREVFAELGSDPEPDEVRQRLNAKLGRHHLSDVPDVQSAFRKFRSEQADAKGWTYGTQMKIATVGRHIEDSGLMPTFAKVSKDTLAAYLSWLRSELHMTDTTAHRHMGYVRWFLFWAEDKGWLRDRTWRTFKPRFKQPQKPVIFLTWPELMKVWDWKGPEWLERIRDIFALGAFTSLRYSDLMALRRADIVGGAIRVVTQKTADPIVIELNKWSREILDRTPLREDGLVFKPVTNQVCNRGLKEICKACGIDVPVAVTTYRAGVRKDTVSPKWKLIGTHAARRTFICNALTMGISPTTVMQWTGHSDFKAMRPYVAVADSERAKAMKGFDRLGKTKTGRRK